MSRLDPDARAFLESLRRHGDIWPGDEVRKVSIEPGAGRVTIEYARMDPARDKVGEQVRRLREQAPA